MLDSLIEILLQYLPLWAILLLLIIFGFVVLSKYRVELEIHEEACSTWVVYESRRVYRSINYRVKYPHLALIAVWLHNLEIRYFLKYPRPVQVEDVGYVHPDHDLSEEQTPFSKLGKTEITDKYIKQVIPKAAVKEAFLLRDREEWAFPFTISFPVYRPKGVNTVVMEVSYPLEEELDGKVVTIENDCRRDERTLGFVIRKNERLSKIYNFQLRYPLPQFVKSFVEEVEIYPPIAPIAATPQDISILSTCPYNLFDREQTSESYELNWIFDVTQDAVVVRFRYNEV